MRKVFLLLLLLALSTIYGCTPFMEGYRYGYTNRQAMNKYYLVKENTFGGKRLQYSEKYFSNTAFDAHLKKYGNPELVYEYPVGKKNQGIKLYYLKTDSVYTFESRKNKCNCISLTKTEKINELEKTTYNQLAGMKN
ncbi:MAG: hypothetical protein V4539_18810 [Bacteroidota bacterium]